MNNLGGLAQRLGEICQQKNLMLATAESCTGGWLAQVITSVPGSSAWFERGFVTYSNRAKQELLGVDATILQNTGAVSEQTALAMANGALFNSHANVSMATTGIAGPGGGTRDKPVGTVWFAWGNPSEQQAVVKHFSGDREQVREQSVAFILQAVIAWLPALPN